MEFDTAGWTNKAISIGRIVHFLLKKLNKKIKTITEIINE